MPSFPIKMLIYIGARWPLNPAACTLLLGLVSGLLRVGAGGAGGQSREVHTRLHVANNMHNYGATTATPWLLTPGPSPLRGGALHDAKAP